MLSTNMVIRDLRNKRPMHQLNFPGPGVKGSAYIQIGNLISYDTIKMVHFCMNKCIIYT